MDYAVEREYYINEICDKDGRRLGIIKPESKTNVQISDTVLFQDKERRDYGIGTVVTAIFASVLIFLLAVIPTVLNAQTYELKNKTQSIISSTAAERKKLLKAQYLESGVAAAGDSAIENAKNNGMQVLQDEQIIDVELRNNDAVRVYVTTDETATQKSGFTETVKEFFDYLF